MATIRITADDFGVHTNIDNGIIDCVRNRTINNVDAMVTFEHSEARIVQFMKDFRNELISGDLSLGLHLSLTCGSPLYMEDTKYLKAIAKYDSINKKKHFFKYSGGAGLEMIENIEKLIKGYLPQLMKEKEAQYVKFKQIAHRVIPNYEPSQISSHLGVYIANRDIYEASREFCKVRGLTMRCPTLLSYDPNFKQSWKEPKQRFLPEGAIKFLAGAEGKKLLKWVSEEQRPAFEADRANGLKSTDYFVEYFLKNGTLENLRTFVGRMNHPDMGNRSFEFVVHPVQRKTTQGLPNGISTIGFYKRAEECEVLKSPEAKEFLREIIHRRAFYESPEF